MKARLLVTVALGLGGCGLAPSAHCDFRPAGEDRCQERLNSAASEVFKGTCGATSAVAADGPCPTQTQVAGCTFGNPGDGSTINDWYYPPVTPADVMVLCAKAGGMPLVP
jgi:hypothetical protein